MYFIHIELLLLVTHYISSVFDSSTSKSLAIMAGKCVYFETFATKNCFRFMYKMNDTRKKNNLLVERLHVIFNMRKIKDTFQIRTFYGFGFMVYSPLLSPSLSLAFFYKNTSDVNDVASKSGMRTHVSDANGNTPLLIYINLRWPWKSKLFIHKTTNMFFSLRPFRFDPHIRIKTLQIQK